MKRFSFLVLVFLFSHFLQAQTCLPSGITFTTQGAIDSFPINYPGCTEILGNVNIGEFGTPTPITDLNGLISVINVEGNINISNCELTNLTGLNNVDSIGGYLYIGGNDNLTNLTGLDNLAFIGSSLELSGNVNLSNLIGVGNLTSIGGFYILPNSNLTSLTGLESLTTIGGALQVWHSNNLTSLTGLENVTSIGVLELWENNNLSSLNGLNNVASIGGSVEAFDNGLINFSGLESLTSIGGSLAVGSCNELTSLTGLDNLTSIGGGVGIQNNLNLTSIVSLSKLLTVGSFTSSIFNNVQLSDCSINYLCDYLGGGGDTTSIYNNGQGCNGASEILLNCNNIGRVYYPIFYDLNENGAPDSGEPLSNLGSVLIEPGNVTSYPNNSTAGYAYLFYEEEHSISYNQTNTPNWDLTTDSSTFIVNLDANNNVDTVYFGVYPNAIISDVAPIIVSGNFRCNETVLFNIFAENIGTTFPDGTLWFTVDTNVLNISYIDIPDTIISPNNYGWNFGPLYPGNTIHKQISVQIPGPPDIALGDELYFYSYVEYTDINGIHNSDTIEYHDEVLCAYDPNDKLVSPEYPFNYALIGEELVFTIRFQNTGNAEAYDVVLRDTLDPNLDPSTFRMIASSHDTVLSVSMELNQYLTFNFDDIYLPDSTTNYEESQGFVIYAIRAFDGIEEGTVINNSASIYFDYNPPIVTNTTENVMVYSFDVDEDGYDIFEDCNDMNASTNPGATEIIYNGDDDDCDPLTLDDDLDQDGFPLAEDCDDMNASINPSVTEIAYNGEDDDCDPLTLDDDLDQDGFPLAEDCDDTNALINPDATEIPNNGIDEDCDGEDEIVSTHQVPTPRPSIYPNPTTGLIDIELHSTTQANIQVKDFNGKLLLQQEMTATARVNLSDFPDGVYLLLIQTEEYLWMERVVKM